MRAREREHVGRAARRRTPRRRRRRRAPAEHATAGARARRRRRRTGSCPSQSRWATQSGTPSVLEDPVPRAHRPQVADVLVGDGAEADRSGPTSTTPATAAGRGRGRGTSWCRRRPGPGAVSSSGTYDRPAARTQRRGAQPVDGRRRSTARRARRRRAGRRRGRASCRWPSPPSVSSAGPGAGRRRTSSARSAGSPSTAARRGAEVGGGLVGEQAAHAVADGVGVAGDAGGDRGRAAGGGLGEGHAPALAGRRRGDDPGPPVQVDELVVAEAPGEARPSARRRASRTSSSSAGPLVAVADDRPARGRGPLAGPRRTASSSRS